jgi:hypothetical protein
MIDRLIDVRILPMPLTSSGGYTIEWQPLLTEDENAKADRLVKRTQAMVAYAGSLVPEIMMPVEEYRADEMGIDAESAYEMPDVVDTEDSIGDEDVDIDEAA